MSEFSRGVTDLYWNRGSRHFRNCIPSLKAKLFDGGSDDDPPTFNVRFRTARAE